MVYLGKTSSHRMILEIFGEHNRKVKALVGNGFAPGTIERYKTSLKHTKEFIQSKYNVDDLSVGRINHAFIAEMSVNHERLRILNFIANTSSVALNSPQLPPLISGRIILIKEIYFFGKIFFI